MSKRNRHRRHNGAPPGTAMQPRFKQKKEYKPKELDFGEFFKPMTAAFKRSATFLNHEASDGAIAIAATSFMDELLKFGIVMKFKREKIVEDDALFLFRPSGPLGTFSAKIVLGSVLGLVPNQKTREELDVMRDIRNAFCHTLYERKFSDPDIAQKCGNLKYSSGKGDQVTIAVETFNKRFEPVAKAKFVISTLVVLAVLSYTLIAAYFELKLSLEHKADVTAKAKALFDEKLGELVAHAQAKNEQAPPPPRAEQNIPEKS